MKKVSLRVPDQMHETLVRHSKDQDRSMANMILHYTRIEMNKRTMNGKKIGLPPIDVMRENDRNQSDVMDVIYGNNH
jgi:hypothetical protein